MVGVSSSNIYRWAVQPVQGRTILSTPMWLPLNDHYFRGVDPLAVFEDQIVVEMVLPDDLARRYVQELRGNRGVRLSNFERQVGFSHPPPLSFRHLLAALLVPGQPRHFHKHVMILRVFVLVASAATSPR
jgi:hypothetical protein